MQAIKCEMCGGNDIIKQDGLYVCQHCGTKYSIEEAKKLMSGVKVVIDNSGSVQNYLTLAQNALEAENFKEAENYSNKIIEINPNITEAWFIKGEAAGWQSTVANKRFQEACTCFKKYLDIDNSDDNKAKVIEKSRELAYATIALPASIYAEDGSENSGSNLNQIVTDVTTSISELFNSKGLGEPDLETAYNYAATSIHRGYISSFNRYQGTDGHPTDDEFVSYLNESYDSIICLNLLISFMKDKDNKISAYKTGIEICTDREKSCSYEIGRDGNWIVSKTLTDENKRININTIMHYHNKIKELDPSYNIPERPLPTGEGCYIATCVYGSYDCPEVWTLRRFRDNIMSTNVCGRLFIHTYYAISPTLVKLFGEYEWFKAIGRKPLNALVNRLKEKGISDKPYQDKQW